VGFHVVDRLAAANGWRFEERRYQAHLTYGHHEMIKVALVKPQTYMNLSGKAVRRVAYLCNVPPARVLVIYDDLDLPLGSIRLRPKGGAGGHQGVASVIAHLHTRDFPRLRIGIGRPPGQMPPESYVLRDFRDDEKSIMEQTYQQAVESVRVVLRDGINAAMNQFN
jgi:PTH1 family peptidyl-tRNA hydrolase